MDLKLYYHPLASFCWKTLIALYENGTAFEPCLVDLGEEVSRAGFLKLWPIGKMPVLRDAARDRTVAETSIIIEYLDQHYPGEVRFLPADADLALETRFRDRFYDLYVQQPMQKVVLDRIRPADSKDPRGVKDAFAQLATAYSVIERDMAAKTWATGDAFTLADCAAAPALFYADKALPLGDAYPHTAAYLARLKARASFARVLTEAEPYFWMLPLNDETAAKG